MGRGIHGKTVLIVLAAHAILEKQNPMTLRQLFYQLVSVRVLANRPSEYTRLSRIMTDARERGDVPYEWIVDRSRPTYRVSAWDDPAQYMETVRNAYRKDYWKEQPCHVEVWTEKDAIIGSIQPVTDEYGVIVRVARGFISTTRVQEIANFFDTVDKPIHVLYLGDHDPSGACIERDAAKRVHERMSAARFEDSDRITLAVKIVQEAPELHKMIIKGKMTQRQAAKKIGLWYGAERFAIERLAIHPEDIRAFDLPPLRIKATDSRARSFARKYGRECVELDALPADELRHRLEEAILGRMNRRAWDRAVEIEKAEQRSIERICTRMINGQKRPRA